MGLLKEYYARGYIAGHSRGYIDRMVDEMKEIQKRRVRYDKFITRNNRRTYES